MFEKTHHFLINKSNGQQAILDMVIWQWRPQDYNIILLILDKDQNPRVWQNRGKNFRGLNNDFSVHNLRNLFTEYLNLPMNHVYCYYYPAMHKYKSHECHIRKFLTDPTSQIFYVYPNK
jgi:hypothetical protein